MFHKTCKWVEKRCYAADASRLSLEICLVAGESPNLKAAAQNLLGAVEKMQIPNLKFLATYRFFSTNHSIFDLEALSFIRCCFSGTQALLGLD